MSIMIKVAGNKKMVSKKKAVVKHKAIMVIPQ